LRKINTCAITGAGEITDLVGRYLGSRVRASEKLFAYEKEHGSSEKEIDRDTARFAFPHWMP